MKLRHVLIGTASRLPGKAARTGIFKHPVSGAVIIDSQGMAGDAICNRKHHGGIDQAVYIEGALTLDWWASELARPYDPGLFGENMIIDDLDNRSIAVGDRFLFDDVVLEATSPRTPCSTFTLRMQDKTFARRYRMAARPGIYTRVIRGGMISAGEAVRIEPFAGERVTMVELLQGSGRKPEPQDRARYLAAPIHHKLRALILEEDGKG